MEEFLAGLSQLVADYGGPGLFVFCLLAASILPISSELALVSGMEFGLGPWEALLWASAGNCVGIAINYGIGYLFNERMTRKLSEGRFGRKAIEWSERHGKWALLLSWTPFLGDPLTYAAGAFRIHFLMFVLITFPLRVARYFVFTIPYLS